MKPEYKIILDSIRCDEHRNELKRSRCKDCMKKYKMVYHRLKTGKYNKSLFCDTVFSEGCEKHRNKRVPTVCVECKKIKNLEYYAKNKKTILEKYKQGVYKQTNKKKSEKSEKSE